MFFLAKFYLSDKRRAWRENLRTVCIVCHIAANSWKYTDRKGNIRDIQSERWKFSP